MTHFEDSLQRIGRDLHLPPSLRSRVLLEIESDLEDLYEHHRSKGLPEKEALRHAEESLVLSDQALRSLTIVHLRQRITDQLAAPWQRAFASLLVIFAIAMVCESFFSLGAPSRLGPFSLFILTLAAGAAAMVTAETLRRRRKAHSPTDTTPRETPRSPDGLLLTAAASLLIGGTGFLVELFLGLRHWAAGATPPELGFRLLDLSILIIVATTTAIAAGTAWFLLSGTKSKEHWTTPPLTSRDSGEALNPGAPPTA